MLKLGGKEAITVFWVALLRFAAVAVVLPVAASVVWLFIYQFCSFLLPNWLTGLLAKGVVWARNATVTNRAIVILVVSGAFSMLLWSNLWTWMLLISLAAAGTLLLTSRLYSGP
jgi:hypothetical protein